MIIGHRRRTTGARGATAKRWRTRDRPLLLLVAHGRETATASADLTAEASTAALPAVTQRQHIAVKSYAMSYLGESS